MIINRLYSIIATTLTVITIITIFNLESRINTRRLDVLSIQAKNIAVDLWQFNDEACANSTRFFTIINHYKYLRVTDYTGVLFAEYYYDDLNIIENFLQKLHILKSKEYSTNINYNFKVIGKLTTEIYNRQIYLYGNIIIILILVLLIINFYFHQKQSRETLSQMVLEKTKELKESEERIRTTLDSIGEGVLATNTEGIIIDLNPAMAPLLGLKNSDLLGKHIDTVLESIRKEQGTSNDSDYNSCYIEYLSTKDEEVIISLTASTIRDDSHSIIGSVYIFNNITERIRYDEKEKVSQRLNSIGQLASGIAHDFNNMLGGILGAADLMYETIDDNNRDLLDLIIGSAKNAADITAKLLSFSRKGRIQLESTDIHIAINNTATLLKHSISKDIKIITELTADKCIITGDASQIQSIFLNLGINSSHAIRKSGFIKYRTEIKYLDSNFCSQSTFDITSGEYILISIEDTGSGIAKENLDKIFDPFFTTKEVGKGTGLGLAATYGTINQHKGLISVESEVGQGTIFKIYLPLSNIKNNPNKINNSIIKGSGTILLIDDEEMMRKTAKLMLQRLGYEVLQAKDGEEAIRLFSNKKDSIDLVILDVIMPIMDGRECFKRIRNISPDQKIIFASGYSNDSEKGDLSEFNSNGFLAKPYLLKDLSSICNSLVEAR